MVLGVDFKTSDALAAGIAKMKEEFAPVRALIITVEDEVLTLHGSPVDANVDFKGDLEKIASVLTSDKLNAAFLLIKEDEKKYSLITYTTETLPPRQKLIYATATAKLSSELECFSPHQKHISSLAELKADLFQSETAETRKDLMSESEKTNARIAAMPIAPQQTGMPGVNCPMTDAAKDALKQFLAKEVHAAVFTVVSEKIDCAKTLPADATNEATQAAIPADAPSFSAIHWSDDKSVMLYVMPSSVKPRERMIYASSRASFLSQAKDLGVDFNRKVEAGDQSEVLTTITEAFQDVDFGDNANEEEKPKAPKQIHGKGPRMLFS